MGHGRGIFMIIVCLALVALVVWLVVSSLRRGHVAPAPTGAASAPLPSSRPTAQQILDERLARGEIEVDDYRARLEALRSAAGSAG